MITPEKLEQIACAIKSQPLNESVVAMLRSRYPDVHFTYCMDDDISGHKPLLECSGFNLYLVDGREHCLCLTVSYEHASGVVIAEAMED